MSFEVLIQVTLADEASAAHLTGIRAVTRVRPLMPLQVAHPGEAEATEAAAERSLLGVLGYVPLQLAEVGKALPTVFTRVAFTLG